MEYIWDYYGIAIRLICSKDSATIGLLKGRYGIDLGLQDYRLNDFSGAGRAGFRKENIE